MALNPYKGAIFCTNGDVIEMEGDEAMVVAILAAFEPWIIAEGG